MSAEKERNLGPQPLADILSSCDLKPHDLVSNSAEQLTHKMVARGLKGRRLTRNVQFKILRALNKALDKNLLLSDLFTY